MPVRHQKIKHPRQTSQRFLTSECELPRAEYEVEADSYAEATAMAENLAADSMINISYIEVYLFQ